MAESCVGMIRPLVRPYLRKHPLLESMLTEAATDALLKAAAEYDGSRSAFPTAAYTYITNRLRWLLGSFAEKVRMRRAYRLHGDRQARRMADDIYGVLPPEPDADYADLLEQMAGVMCPSEREAFEVAFGPDSDCNLADHARRIGRHPNTLYKNLDRGLRKARDIAARAYGLEEVA